MLLFTVSLFIVLLKGLYIYICVYSCVKNISHIFDRLQLFKLLYFLTTIITFSGVYCAYLNAASYRRGPLFLADSTSASLSSKHFYCVLFYPSIMVFVLVVVAKVDVIVAIFTITTIFPFT